MRLNIRKKKGNLALNTEYEDEDEDDEYEVMHRF